MPFAFQYAVLATIGLVSGYVAHRLVTSARGSLKRRLLLDRQLDGLAALPGMSLVVLLAQRLPQATMGGYARFGAAFFAPFLVARVATHYSIKRGAQRREGTLAYEMWYELMAKTPARAHEFIERYLAQEAGLLTLAARVRELRTACDSLERAHAGNISLPAALAVLQAHIARLEQERARSLGPPPM